MEEFLLRLHEFMEQGGNVLIAIAMVTALLWLLMIERLIYVSYGLKKDRAKAMILWQQNLYQKPGLQHQWLMQALRKRLVSIIGSRLKRNLALIKTLVALCPLLGLLGTVTGMLEVFETLSLLGNGNARAMAAGVSRATIPTMAGMITALSGILVMTWLIRRVEKELSQLNQKMEVRA